MTAQVGGGSRSLRAPWVLMTLVGGLAILAMVLIYQSASQVLAPSPRPVTHLALSSAQLDFGEMLVHQKVVRQLVLRNEGEVGLEVHLQSDGEAFVISPAAVFLDPGQRTRIQVTATPDAPGNLSNQLQIVSDVEGQKAWMVSLAGSARRPRQRVAAEDESVQAQTVRSTAELAEPSRPFIVPRRAPGPSSMEAARLRAQALESVPPVQAVVVSAGQGNTAVLPGELVSEKQAAPGASRPEAAVGADAEKPQTPAPRVVSSRSLGRISLGELDNGRPARELVQPVGQLPKEISPDEEAAAHPLAGERGRSDLPETPPDDLSGDDDPLNNNPIVSPTLTVSAVSRLTLLGSTAHFYPHEVGIIGTNLGGPTSLMQPLQFPLVPLGLGESILFNQTGVATGSFDAGSGQVTLTFPLQVVDSEGDAAPLQMQVTTGTVFSRNEAGLVVSLTGAPRQPGSGLVHLVGIGRIPPGYRNSAENQPVYLEILATMTFGTSIQTSSTMEYLKDPAGGVF